MNPIPNDNNIEQSILFALIYKPELSDIIIDTARDDWFYNAENKQIWNACTKCKQETGFVDSATVISILHRTDSKGAIANILSGMQFASSMSNIETHLDIVQDYAIRRQIIQSCMSILDEVQQSEVDAFECIDKMANVVTSIQDSDTKIHSMVSSEVIEIFERTERRKPIQTGDPILDNHIYAEAGRHAGHLEVTVAHPGHGKTRYAIYKTVQLARQGIKTHWFQLEDYGYKTAKLLQAILGEQADNIIITDSIFEIERIKREARVSAREYEINNVVVDYVQNLSADKKSRAEDVEYISRQLTRMAIELSVQVHLMSQVTIQDSQRKKWSLEPRSADVRWSRQLQQDAHIMTGVFRPSRVDGLFDEDWAMDWNGNQIPLNSIFIRQLKTRYGEGYTKRYHMIDTEYGPVEYDTWLRGNMTQNNQWRETKPEPTPF
jgi:replicative DNA helicase